eukprot:TRINITY_DN3411_c0_g1_i1.p1 TRINITY_DN3411_c0_g1~~TRINITY_DN3411_c0_g1_i1.p1  ORF type:complete len:460 (-),score=97.15 TRINITY_DN3411_c0_g1_i1:81-1460(-)
MDQTTLRTDVAVIGGGVSGLYAAQLLRKKNKQLNVLVLEAFDTVGGRVRTLSADKFGAKLDLGAHFIHGEHNNVLVDIGKQQGWNISHLGGWPDYHSIPTVSGKIILDNTDERIPMLKQIREHLLLLDEFKQGEKLKKDLSVREYLTHKKIPDWAIRFCDKSLGNDYGGDIDLIGVNAAAHEHAHWSHGPDYLSFNEPFTKIVDFLSHGLNIKTKFQALNVDYTGDLVKITGKDLTSNQIQTIIAKQVIITVSIPILKDGDLSFSPPLPLPKQRALRRLGFGNALKVFLKFSARFWPIDCYDIVCAEDNAFVPEYWFEEIFDEKTNKKFYLATAFAAGKNADQIAASGSEEEIIQYCLQHLNRLFQGRSWTKPASDKFISGMVFNWAKEEFVKGGYSYPAVNREGCNIEDIRMVARPLQGKVFFAGEATNEMLNPTVHGAMATSERVVREMYRLGSARM